MPVVCHSPEDHSRYRIEFPRNQSHNFVKEDIVLSHENYKTFRFATRVCIGLVSSSIQQLIRMLVVQYTSTLSSETHTVLKESCRVLYFDLFILNSISLFTKAELCWLQLTRLFEELGRTYYDVHISVMLICAVFVKTYSLFCLKIKTE